MLYQGSNPRILGFEASSYPDTTDTDKQQLDIFEQFSDMCHYRLWLETIEVYILSWTIYFLQADD